MTGTERKHYTVSGPRGLPILGMIIDANRNQLNFLQQNALNYGEIIPFHIMGQKVVQVNHPDLVRYVLMENHKNYHKSKAYIRFESVLGKGLLTSNGEKWRRDRQKIQPMFKREQIEGYYFDVINHVCEKYRRHWLSLTKTGPVEINITQEMASITVEVIVKLIFGKDNLDENAIDTLHRATQVFMDYLKGIRLLSNVDLHKIFHTPQYFRFKKALLDLDHIIDSLLDQNKKGLLSDQQNMLALLLKARQEDPENFSERDIRDQCATMLFAGFETTAILIQWMWFSLDNQPDITNKIRAEITKFAPCTTTENSLSLMQEDVCKMDYLTAVFKEMLRLYPSFWVTSREPVEDDILGDYKIKRGTLVVLPQIVMHRHPRWWNEPNACIPERFYPENESQIDDGLYFPFSQGARKCSGYRLAEMEAKIIFAKLLPLFNVKIINAVTTEFDPAISLRPKSPLLAKISRA
jgi:cytochrome P450